MKFKLVVSFVLVFLVVSAGGAGAGSSERTVILVGADQDGQTSQNIHIPLFWSENIFSGFSYVSRKYSDTKPLEMGIAGKKGVYTDEDRFELNLLSYKRGMMRMGFGMEYITLDKTELGHSIQTVGDSSDPTTVVFDNHIDIEMIRPVVSADITWRLFDNHLMVRSYCDVSPVARLHVDQETELVINQDTYRMAGRSDKDQKPTASVRGEVQYELIRNWFLGATVRYEYFPIEYTMIPGAGDSDTVDIETVDETFSWDVRLMVNTRFSSFLMPTIGFGEERIKRKAENEHSSDKTHTIRKVIIGFEKRF